MFKKPSYDLCLQYFRIICKRAEILGDDFTFTVEDLSEMTNITKPYETCRAVLKFLLNQGLICPFWKNSSRYCLQEFYKGTFAYFYVFPDKFILKSNGGEDK